VAHHESLSSFRPGFESRSGRLIQVRNGEDLARDPASPIPFSTFSLIGFDAIDSDSENAELWAYHQGSANSKVYLRKCFAENSYKPAQLLIPLI
jgi:hypothetical protein